MAERVLRLGLDARDATRGAREFRRATDDVTRGATGAAGANQQFGRSMADLDGITRTLTRTMAALGVTIGSGALIRGIVNTNREFERLQAQLQTTEGSAAGAAAAFARIEEFAIRTPFEIESLTSALVQLRVRGANPTNEELTALGNLASSFTRDITDVAAAVSSATAGMTLPLRNLGFEASVAGEEITLQFGEASVTVERSASAIVSAMAQLTGGRLAGAMDREMNTINGALSNLEDSAGKVARAIGEGGGLNDAILSTVQTLDGLTNALAENREGIRLWTGVVLDASAAIGVAGLAGATIIAGRALAGLAITGTVVAFAQLAVTVRSVAAAVALLQAAMGPGGWLLLGLGALATATFAWRRSVREARDEVSELRRELDRMHAETEERKASQMLPEISFTVRSSASIAAEEAAAAAEEAERAEEAYAAAMERTAAVVDEVRALEEQRIEVQRRLADEARASAQAQEDAARRAADAERDRARAIEEAARAEERRRQFYIQAGLDLVGTAVGSGGAGGAITGAIGAGLAGFGIAGPAGAAVGAFSALASSINALGESAEETAAKLEAASQRWSNYYLEIQEREARVFGADMFGNTLDEVQQQIADFEAQARIQALGLSERSEKLLIAREKEVRAAERAAEATKRAAEEEERLAAERERALQFAENLYLRGLAATGGDTRRAALAFNQRRELAANPGQSAELSVLHEMERNQLAMTLAIEAVEAAAREQIDRLDEQIRGQQDQLRVAQDQMRVHERALEEARRLVETLGRFRDSLTLGPLSVLSPVDRLVEARRQFESVYAQAQGGDATAAANLPAVAQAFLEASREVNASSLAYAADFKAVTAAVDAIQGRFADQANIEELILQELQQQSNQLAHQINELQAQQQAIRQAATDEIAAIKAEFNSETNKLWGVFQRLLDIKDNELSNIATNTGTDLAHARSLVTFYETEHIPGIHADYQNQITGWHNYYADLILRFAQAQQDFGEGRAHGGPVWSGQSYTVGERGRERFVPHTSGTIQPSGRESMLSMEAVRALVDEVRALRGEVAEIRTEVHRAGGDFALATRDK